MSVLVLALHVGSLTTSLVEVCVQLINAVVLWVFST